MLALASAGIACGAGPPSATDRLRPCTSDEGPTDAYCGRLEVFENRQAGQGRKIALKIVVLPALSNDPQPDPLFFLAGGPGQGAARMAGDVREAFRRVQASRDIVLVDQRGTGDSNGLECTPDGDTLASLNESDAVGLTRLKTCLAGYDADPRFYTTPIAMDDLDDVRRFLGYDRINIYGGSYGTRAGLVYLRQHGDHVRAIVLDGVAPPDMRLPLYFARDAQRALDRLLADCAANASCAAKYPRLADRVRALFARLEAEPVEVSRDAPAHRRGRDLRVSAELLAGLVTGALYSPLTVVDGAGAAGPGRGQRLPGPARARHDRRIRQREHEHRDAALGDLRGGRAADRSRRRRARNRRHPVRAAPADVAAEAVRVLARRRRSRRRTTSR